MVSVLPLGGCATFVQPPAQLAQPAPVFLLDHGRHASLVLPTEQGLTRYEYGDWVWFVEARRTPATAFSALFCDTQGALGRQAMRGPPTPQSVRRQVPVLIEELYPLCVEADLAEALHRRLADLYAASPRAEVYRAELGLSFVSHPAPYGLWSNSNHMVADWLMELGVEVEVGGPLSRWKIRGAQRWPECLGEP